MQILPFVHQLLYKHDCVIVPDFGAFIATYKPAYIVQSGQTMHPPARIVAFNSDLINNDGLLANAVSQQTRVTYEQATEIIADASRLWFIDLESGKHLKLDKIGSLYFDDEHHLQFIPADDQNFLLDSYGYEVLKLKQVKHEKTMEIIQEVKSNKNGRKRQFKIRYLEAIPVAAAMLILFLFPQALRTVNSHLSSLFPVEVMDSMQGKIPDTSSPIPVFTADNNKNNSVSDNTPITKINEDVNNNPIIEPKKEIAKEVAPTPEPVVIKETPIITIPETKKIIAKEKTSPPVPSPMGNNFYIVAGCFGVEENAKKFMKELISDGLPASIAGKRKGMYVVSCFNASTELEARQKLEEVKLHLDNNAWIAKSSELSK
ncbi:MAG: SPOR domain-containing protein [Bacteroidetes bacterium]|nr:SPOR domain-containing protein [Bacteroidota bacterium]